MLLTLSALGPCSGMRKKHSSGENSAQLSAIPSVSVNDALTKVAESQQLLESAKQAAELGPKWKALVGSLQGAKAAATDSGAAVIELGSTLTGIKKKIREFGLESLFDGHITLDDLKLLGHVGTCIDIMAELLSCAQVLDSFANLAKQVVEVAVNVQDLTDSTTELTSAWADLDLGNVVPPLLEKVTAAVTKFHAEAEKLAKINADMNPLIEGWDDRNFMGKGWHLANYGDDIMAGFTKLSSSWTNTQELYAADAKPIQMDMESVVGSMVSAAAVFNVMVSGGGAATEMIDSSLCASERPRRFTEDANVDETTMSCWNEPVLGGKWCSCAGEGDCYVDKSNRPAPLDLKRCFKKV